MGIRRVTNIGKGHISSIKRTLPHSTTTKKTLRKDVIISYFACTWELMPQLAAKARFRRWSTTWSWTLALCRLPLRCAPVRSREMIKNPERQGIAHHLHSQSSLGFVLFTKLLAKQCITISSWGKTTKSNQKFDFDKKSADSNIHLHFGAFQPLTNGNCLWMLTQIRGMIKVVPCKIGNVAGFVQVWEVGRSKDSKYLRLGLVDTNIILILLLLLHLHHHHPGNGNGSGDQCPSIVEPTDCWPRWASAADSHAGSESTERKNFEPLFSSTWQDFLKWWYP